MVIPGIRTVHTLPLADINITIVESNQTEFLELIIQGVPYETTIRADDFEDLLQSFTQIATNLPEQSQFFTPERCKSFIISDLISVGRAAFNRLFGDARKALKYHLDRLGGQEVISILVSSVRSLNAGWFYCNLANPDEPYTINMPFEQLLEHFWGVKFNVIHAHLVKQHTHVPLEYTEFIPEIPLIENSSPKAVGLIVDNLLPYALNERAEITAHLSQVTNTLINEFLYETNMELTDFRSTLTSFIFNDNTRMLHFVCEVQKGTTSSATSLKFRNNPNGTNTHLHYRIIDMEQVLTNKIRAEMIFLNCCSGGVTRTDQSINFAETFLRQGARVVLASPVPIESYMASKFASDLYSELLHKQSLGHAVLLAKRKALSQLINLDSDIPLEQSSGISPQLALFALFYAVYGNSEWKL